MAFKMILLVRRKAGLTPEQFRKGYENSHSRIGVRLYGHLWTEYRRNYLGRGANFNQTRACGSSGPDEIGFDAVSEFIVRDEAAWEEMQRISAANQELIQEDEARWFDQVHSYIVPCETIEEDLSLCHKDSAV
jgi:hypothetical protein